MKIAMLTIYPPQGANHANFGGVAGYSKSLITAISESNKNNEIVVIANKLQNQPREWSSKNLHVLHCFDRNLKYIYQVSKILHVEKPDIVHVQQELGLYGGILTAVLLPIILMQYRNKIITTIHGIVSPSAINSRFVKENNSSLPPKIVQLAFKLIFKPIGLFSSRVIVHEKAFADILINDYGFASHKVKVVPLGIDNYQKISKKAARETLNIPRKMQVILFMGYLTGYKGLDLLIDAFYEYHKSHSDSYLIIGAGPHPKLANDSAYIANTYERLKNKAKRIATKNYRWAGFIEDDQLDVYYSAADVTIYPYTIAMASSGPMSISISYGVPFICSDAFKLTVSDQSLQFKQNVNDLNQKLEEFFAGRIDMRYITKIKEMRSWRKIASKSLKIYKEVHN